jgi:RNA polymerase sigma-70 factor (family 1)
MNSLHDEADVLSALRQGSEQAFEKIYQAYSNRLFGKLIKMVKSETYAKEILQDVFLKVWEHRASIDPQKSFRSYLFQIAQNKAFDFFRKAAREKDRQSELIASSSINYTLFEEFKSNDENLKTLEKAIEALPLQRQKVFRLCKLEGKSYKEASELLQISVSTISDHIVKGTKTIRHFFVENPSSLS